MLGRSRTILDDLYFDRNSCSRYLEQSVSALRFLTDCGSGRVEATYSSQNEMICDELASFVFPGFCSRAQTHIICEPVVLEGLHVFPCHCMSVSRHEWCAWGEFELVQRTSWSENKQELLVSISFEDCHLRGSGLTAQESIVRVQLYRSATGVCQGIPVRDGKHSPYPQIDPASSSATCSTRHPTSRPNIEIRSVKATSEA